MEVIDLTSQKFGRLTVLKFSHKIEKGNNRRYYWLCKCDCGNETIVNSASLKNGHTLSCGCLRVENLKKVIDKHNQTGSDLYYVWAQIKQRCNNKNNKRYKDYGGRGITVCNEWLNDFISFYNWAMANGYDENAPRGKCTIDRIDVNGNYEPSNCRWLTNKKQQNNKRNNHFVTYNNETLTVTQMAEKYNINVNTFRNRVAKGWNIDKCINYNKKGG